MLKWLVHWLKKFWQFSFGRKQNPSLNLEIQKIVQPPPELTNSDLEYLFTQLLEGVHQARGQHWALKYLERMENRISTQRWIDWLLDFGEKLLMSPAPNIQLAMRMMQLGELEIGKIGELAYEIGTSLLTRNLGEPQHDNHRQDAESPVLAALFNPVEKELTRTGEPQHENHRQQTKTVTPVGGGEGILGELLWEYDELDTETTKPVPAWTPLEEEGEQGWIEQSVEALSQSTQLDESLASLQPNVAVTLDELFVRLEQSSDLAQQLAYELGMEAISQSQTPVERSQAWFYLGLQQAKTGELSKAITSYDKAIEINPDSYEYWFNRGLALFYLGNVTEAIASYDKAIESKPNFYKGWYNRGGALGELGRFEDAIASFDKAIEIKFDYYQAWSSRGLALLKLGCPEDAISSYDQALLLQPEDQENWYYRGMALVVGGRKDDAIASYEKAIEIQPDFHLAWYNRGVELSNLGRLEDAIASFQQALEIYSDLQEGWYALGSAQDKLGRWDSAMASYNHAIQINPDFVEVLIDQGVLLASLGRWHDAISSWEKALEIKPDLYLAWFNQAVALENLGRREEAIASYEKSLEINPDFHLAWYNRGVALFYLGSFEESIASYDKALQIQLDYWEAWIGRGTAAGSAVINYDGTNPGLSDRGYEGKLASYEEGLKYVHQDTHPEGWGRLHLLLGNAYYDRGKKHPTPFYYWQQAVAEYYQARVTLTPEAFAELHLEVLLHLITTLLGLGETDLAQEFHQLATDLLRCLLSEPNRTDDSKKAMALKFAGFEQLAVDIAVQCGELAQALEIAEHGKNACLYWLLFGWSDEIVSPNYASIQQLLNSTTAIIYWHISPSTLRTFILKYNSPEPIPVFTPVRNVSAIDEMPLPEAVKARVEFEDWLEDWNQQYHDYRSQPQDTQNKSQHSWRDDMEQRLLNLKNILKIAAIVEELDDITQLILIPHRDLHRFPLHALFQEERIDNDNDYQDEPWERQSVKSNFTFTYLPSAQLGLSLKSEPLWQIHKQSLLSVEHPNTTGYPPLKLKLAKLETEAISHMFPTVKRIQGSKATKKQVENYLSDNYNIFHFNGYGINNFSNPQQSKLTLAGGEQLTIEEICRLQIANYYLVTLSACESPITGSQTITTEYVGLVSAFLFQGVSHILSTLWTVDSAASALVMIEFYRQIQQTQSAASALLTATEWLREVTASELKKWYVDLLHEMPQEGLRIRTHLATELYRISKMPPDKKLYNHPYYWAGFTIAGRQS
ncbi:MAG: tetratricopeptide repeat protein [Stigonema ocellatum SAG 48.90 = DSM 106950]|nr:tetratricopeptide repeat protein [Stigonema ocellatum SAG 48.90 = DSM 106950]